MFAELYVSSPWPRVPARCLLEDKIIYQQIMTIFHQIRQYIIKVIVDIVLDFYFSQVQLPFSVEANSKWHHEN